MPKYTDRKEPLTSLGGRPWTKKELCEWANCSPRFIEIEVAHGRLRAVRLGNKFVRFLPRDIERWTDSRPRWRQPIQRLSWFNPPPALGIPVRRKRAPENQLTPEARYTRLRRFKNPGRR